MGISLPPRPCNAVPQPSCSDARCVADCQASAATSAGAVYASLTTQEACKLWPSPSVGSFRARSGHCWEQWQDDGEGDDAQQSCDNNAMLTCKALGNLNNHIGVPLAPSYVGGHAPGGGARTRHEPSWRNPPLQ